MVALENAALVGDFLLDLFPTVKVHACPVCELEVNEEMISAWSTFQIFLRGHAARKVFATYAEREEAPGLDESPDVKMGVSTEH